MTLKEQDDPGYNLEEKRPKTPHEEIMFCIESTNDIVSELAEFYKWLWQQHWKDFKAGKKK